MKQQCFICFEGKFKYISSVKSPYTSKKYKLYQCASCHSRAFDINEYPNVDLQNHYNARSEEQDYLSAPFIMSKYWTNEIKNIQKLHEGLPNRVLDIGCRTGDFLLHWPQTVSKVGVELSVLSATVAVERGLDVKQDFLENVNFSSKFDVVVAYAILEHLEKPEKFLRSVTNLLNDKGVLVIMIPSYQTFKAKLLEFFNIRWHMYSPPEHLCLYSREFLDNYLEAKGFALVKRHYTSGGMFNPFRRVPLIGRVFSKIMWLIDTYSLLNRFPIFDHMYSYYVYSG